MLQTQAFLNYMANGTIPAYSTLVKWATAKELDLGSLTLAEAYIQWAERRISQLRAHYSHQ